MADRLSIYRAVWTMRSLDGCRLSPQASPVHRENLPSRPPSTQLSVSIFRSDAALADLQVLSPLRNDGL